MWLGALVSVISLNDIKASTTIAQGREITWSSGVWFMTVFMIFGVLWILNLVDYLSRFIVIVSASTYYFNHKSNVDELNSDAAEVQFGFICAYVYHFGSIAMGSFIIGLVKFIKYVFYFLAKRLVQCTGENKCLKNIVKCATCCLGCVEDVCEYLSETAFCYQAVSGESFFESAKKAFLLNLKHGVKFAFAQFIAKVFIFLGKIAITVGNIFSLLFIMNNITNDSKEVKSFLGPCFAVGLVTWLTASLFLGIFEHGVVAMLICICIDLDMNGGVLEYGPATFHEKIKKVNVNKEKRDKDSK